MSLRSQIALQDQTIAMLRAENETLRGSRSSGEWAHKDTWRKEGNNFLVTIEHFRIGYTPSRGEGVERWCVYAYVYPKHPRFKAFKDTDIRQDATNDLPLHGGCTYLRRHTDNDGAVCSIQVGADYNHLHDSFFTRLDSFHGSEVQTDAARLFAVLAAEVAAAAGSPIMAVVGAQPRDDMGGEVSP